MATAYAALVSVMHLLKRILHPSMECTVQEEEQIKSLQEKVCPLVDLLEDLSNRRRCSKFVTDELKNQITITGHEAEDIIDSYVPDTFVCRLIEMETRFCEDIKRVTETMHLIKVEIEKKKMDVQKHHHQPINSSPDDALSRRAPSSGKLDVMVGFEDHLDKMMRRLATTESKLQIIPIVGMAGIGKTTLAKNIYENRFIVEHFHSRAWVAVSQAYTVREILLALLYDVQILSKGKKQEFNEKMSEKNDEELGEQLHKSLFGRRYLIVLDDIWSAKPWDEVKRFFPDNCKGSRIMITTRLSNVAMCFGSDNSHELEFLDVDESWNLFCEKIFPEESCPLELEEIGKRIATSCGGLPLAIVVIGGLLAKASKTREYWEYVAENLNSLINSGDDDYCLKLLSLSYNDLPIHLKPCFLYMAMFPEDCEIKVSRLIKLWVAEGFLKPIKDKSLEDVAMVYLKDLIDRNLVLVSGRGKTGKMKTCIIHDVMGDLCLKEAQKENFLCVTRVYSLDNIPQGIESKRRLAIHQSMGKPCYFPQVFDALKSASNARSLVCDSEWISPRLVPSLNLLRVLDVVDKYSPQEITKLSSSRYLAFRPDLTGCNNNPEIISLMFAHWNVQTFKTENVPGVLVPVPPQIWEMTELRHLEFRWITLPDPPPESHNFYILENLQTLLSVENLRCTEEVVKRVPNLRKLKVFYVNLPQQFKKMSYYCLNNLVHLHNLESLTLLIIKKKISVTNIAFPRSLKRLSLDGCGLPWSDIKVVGSLPQLEVLLLFDNAFKGPRWDATDGEFVRLKYLAFNGTDLMYWTADNTHFPMLETLHLIQCPELEEIPFGFAEIPTLQVIHLRECKRSVITSARAILEEREDLGYEGLQASYFDEQEDYSRNRHHDHTSSTISGIGYHGTNYGSSDGSSGYHGYDYSSGASGAGYRAHDYGSSNSAGSSSGYQGFGYYRYHDDSLSSAYPIHSTTYNAPNQPSQPQGEQLESSRFAYPHGLYHYQHDSHRSNTDDFVPPRHSTWY
ncbi:hypothetical protein BUALT_Bualt07G0113400 [Buddleja alternifolia]|uniref:Uncharacterized protein n=1 Tax=Buddleja alternifolia TaxID=168488 RepID=A0AAV6XGW9_9LAMI|nr:hypothetical protein BUALT_Bualt07G0113400 [Buddleja alternifolia]